jgi:predicted DNA-binding protein
MAKISIEIPDDLNERLNKFCFWGVKSAVMRKVIEQLCDAVEVHGTGVLTLVVEGKYNIVARKELHDGLE